MTATQTAPEAPTHAPPQSKAFALAPPRAAVKKGVPADGFWILSGFPKSGKTALVASRPKTVILEMERGGADRVDGWVQEIPDLPTFRQALLSGIRDPGVEGIAIDTLDVLVGWLMQDVADQFGLESMSERKEGVSGFAVWAEMDKRIHGLVQTFKTCGKLVLAPAHYKEPRIDSDGKLIVSTALNAPGKMATYLMGQADAIGHCFKRQVGQGTQYVLSFQGGGIAGTFGSRIAELEDKVIVLPRTDQWAAVEAVFKPAPAKSVEASNGTKAQPAARKPAGRK